MKEKICFVVMAFGSKIDYHTSRVLDMDKTYKGIIKPAAELSGYKCIRSDEVIHSGSIDFQMYKYIIESDLVIADISTLNPNALYELGIRHAVKPFSTIVISENQLEYPFDINHTVIKTYEHLGKGLDFEEVERFKNELVETIKIIEEKKQVDSPVYLHLNNLEPPKYITTKDESKIDENQSLAFYIEEANKLLRENNFIEAMNMYIKAKEVSPYNSFILQRIVLTTYKSEIPSKLEALNKALKEIAVLKPDITNDIETLGLYGAINKRLWDLKQDIGYLNKAIFSYKKGFYLQNDYYNGINLAFLLNVRASLGSGNDRIADYVSANRIRVKVIEICKKLLCEKAYSKEETYWIYATLEEAYFGLKDFENYNNMKEEAIRNSTIVWKRKSTEEQIMKLNELISIDLKEGDNL